MEADKIYINGTVQEDFTFNERVAEVFDDMVCRSVPFYGAVIDCIAGLLRQMARPGVTLFDLGCSTGSTLLELSRRLEDLDMRFIGVDNAPAMLEKARRKAAMFSHTGDIRFVEADITSVDLSGADIIICNYTLQFVRPLVRQDFVNRLARHLSPGGILIISEKIISHDPRLNREYINMYHRFKRQHGYSELEIAAKREALENVLIPFSIQENMELLRQAGFTSVETFFQWCNFASFIAVKPPKGQDG